jgi:YVTN family beta-propeller protein
MDRRVRTERRGARCGTVALAMLLGLLVMSPGAAAAKQPAAQPSFATATTSSPIAMSRDGRLVWSVNPTADNVSVIRTDRNQVIAGVGAGREPQAVALTPDNRYAYVANAAAGTVTVIRIADARPAHFKAVKSQTLRTGAEPWNIVTSPDGRRVFVANSSEDTITVIDAAAKKVIGSVDVRNSVCNDPDRARHFQPRGLAVAQDNTKLYVTSFLAFTRPGGHQADDTGRQGVVCRLTIDTRSKKISAYRPAARITLAPQITGFMVDSDGDGAPNVTSAFPNQLQSIVIRGGQAYLPNIAASPDGPLRFNVDTQAFVSVINGVRRNAQSDAGAAKFFNLHLGARDPEPGKKRIFFANPWAIAFTSQRGAGAAYVASAGSDLLVKVNVAADGKLTPTVDADTTRYIDLRDPANPATAGANAGKNPQGLVISSNGKRAYVMNFVSRNVSVVDLSTDKVVKVIRTAALPAPGSPQEVVSAGADMFFSTRGEFNAPPGATVLTRDRLSSEGWQSCASCHFKGLTDGVIWEFNSGPRKSVPLNATFNPNDRNDQRILNYSAIFDEVDDFEANIRNISGPGPLAAAQDCALPPPPQSMLDPNHGLVIGDDGNINIGPCVLNAFAKPNADRQQVTITLPGSTVAVPALTALREWVRFAVRTPQAPFALRTGAGAALVSQGRVLFQQAGCATCHLGGKWTLSTKNFASPPAAADVTSELTPPPTAATVPPGTGGNPVAVQFLPAFLRNVGTWNVGVAGTGNDLAGNIGAPEKAAPALVNGVAQPAQDALGLDQNGDGKGTGFNVPSVLGLLALPPYFHNGACESLACVLTSVPHRTAANTQPDKLPGDKERAAVTAFLESIDATTPAP